MSTQTTPARKRARRWRAAVVAAVAAALSGLIVYTTGGQTAPPSPTRPTASGDADAGVPSTRPAEAVPPAAPEPPPPFDPAGVVDEWSVVERLPGAGVPDLGRTVHVTQLSLSGDVVSDRDFAELNRLPHLKSLTVRGVDDRKVTAAAFEHVAALPALEELDASGVGISDDACRHIGTMKKLKTLRLAGTRVSDDGLAQLGGLTRLQVLSVAGTTVSADGLAALNAPDLTALDLRGVRLKTADLKVVGRFTSLRYLRLPAAADPEPLFLVYQPPEPGRAARVRSPDDGREFDRDGYEVLPAALLDYRAGLPHLSGLVNLESVGMTGVFPEAGPNRRFESVGQDTPWDHMPLADGFADPLGVLDRGSGYVQPVTKVLKAHGLKRTEQGVLVSTDIDEREVPVARPSALGVVLCRPSGALLAHIRDYRHVTSLDLSGFAVADDDLKLLAKHTGLERLDLSGSPITADGLKHLKALPGLRYLNLRGSDVGDADVPLLKAFPKLRDVVLSQSRVTQEGAEAFRKGPLRAVFDPRQRRPTWCELDRPALVRAFGR